MGAYEQGKTFGERIFAHQATAGWDRDRIAARHADVMATAPQGAGPDGEFSRGLDEAVKGRLGEFDQAGADWAGTGYQGEREAG